MNDAVAHAGKISKVRGQRGGKVVASSNTASTAAAAPREEEKARSRGRSRVKGKGRRRRSKSSLRRVRTGKGLVAMDDREAEEEKDGKEARKRGRPLRSPALWKGPIAMCSECLVNEAIYGKAITNDTAPEGGFRRSWAAQKLCSGCMKRAGAGAGAGAASQGYETLRWKCIDCPSFAVYGSHMTLGPSHCKRHRTQGEVDVVNLRCSYPEGCTRQPSYGDAVKTGANGTRVRCALHKQPGQTVMKNRVCMHLEGCGRRATWSGMLQLADGHEEVRLLLCGKHRTSNSTELFPAKRCESMGCGHVASYAEHWGGPALHCRGHKAPGEVNVRRKVCESEGCMRSPTFGDEGSSPRRCKQHMIETMIDVRSRRCKAETRPPLFFFAVDERHPVSHSLLLFACPLLPSSSHAHTHSQNSCIISVFLPLPLHSSQTPVPASIHPSPRFSIQLFLTLFQVHRNRQPRSDLRAASNLRSRRWRACRVHATQGKLAREPQSWEEGRCP
jgi:hypothetical protein